MAVVVLGDRVDGPVTWAHGSSEVVQPACEEEIAETGAEESVEAGEVVAVVERERRHWGYTQTDWACRRTRFETEGASDVDAEWEPG